MARRKTYALDANGQAVSPLTAMLAKVASHQTAACPDCGKAVTPALLARFGQCGTCRQAAVFAGTARPIG